jgi:hypothetical protein
VGNAAAAEADSVAGWQQRTTGVLHTDQARMETACVSPISASEPRQSNARLPAPGRKTRWPGAAQHRRRRAADPHAGSDIKQAFPRGDLVGTAEQTKGGDHLFSLHHRSSQRRSSHRRSSQRRSIQRRTSKQADPEPGGGVRFRIAGLRTRTRRWCALPHRRSPNPNPAVVCASAPPVSEPEPGGGVCSCNRRSSPGLLPLHAVQLFREPPPACFLRWWRGLPRGRPV